MKRFILLGLVLLWTGCSSESANSKNAAGNSPESGKPKVALIMKSLANEFFSTMAKGAEKYQAENPDQFDLVVNGIKDERDLGRQVALVEEMIASNVDAIVIAPADSKALVPVLRRAKKAGIVVVNIDNRLDAEVLKTEGVTIPFVGPDNKAGAKKVGAYLASKLKSGDGVCILEGVLTSFNGQQRFAGFEEAMQEAGLKVIDHQTAEWEMSKANTIASSMLSEHPETKAILAANDSMALGAVAAVKAAGKSDDVLILGFDNISAVQQAIEEGKILATADQHGDQLAIYGIQNALKLLEDSSAVVEDVETPVDLITKESGAK
ncbi:sugar ABC transporter substrate-binding protein [Blastopirellula marina]|uniref:LacI family transcriptional regulator n=1 Tax=Blastopirellula marina TaxID=124 RepID=A0A2S8G130_9BACT|nr:sugar ABC transporter substrate-binding protein [Blastopirellula marina]PQO38149.1 LacI family transcriptional regulator [Blastopirellula marina]PTL44805.1 sugar ABC transporter substrate-binding protein [Blastopirellula marina]